MHVFSDASWNSRTGVFAGAFVIDLYGVPTGLAMPEFCTLSFHAEFLTATAAISFARERTPKSQVVVSHIDIVDVAILLDQKKYAVVRDLQRALANFNAVILGDAAQYREHWACHIHARWVAGIYGTRHPGFHFDDYYKRGTELCGQR